jgi:hypothetical protein
MDDNVAPEIWDIDGKPRPPQEFTKNDLLSFHKMSPDEIFEFVKNKTKGLGGTTRYNDGKKIIKILPDGSQEVWSLGC